MRVLVVAATEFEAGSLKYLADEQKALGGISELESINPKQERIKPQSSELATQNASVKTYQSKLKTHHSLLVTGVGMVATAFALGNHLAQNNYDLAINMGIAGSFDRSIALGELVEITEDTLAELGAEDDEQFITIDKLGFGEGIFSATANLSSYYNIPNQLNILPAIKKASAITVNTVHGNERSIEAMRSRLNPQIESMEGAAFFYACKQFNLPCLQIRAVSNYVEKRNRDAWQIGLAIKNLNNFALQFLEVLRLM